MPVTRIEIRRGRSPAEKKALLEAIQRAKMEAFKIPERDREQMICEYSAEDFEIPPPKVVQERLRHSAIGITLDTYSPVLPGLQEQVVSQLHDRLFGTAPHLHLDSESSEETPNR